MAMHFPGFGCIAYIGAMAQNVKCDLDVPRPFLLFHHGHHSLLRPDISDQIS